MRAKVLPALLLFLIAGCPITTTKTLDGAWRVIANDGSTMCIVIAGDRVEAVYGSCTTARNLLETPPIVYSGSSATVSYFAEIWGEPFRYALYVEEELDGTYHGTLTTTFVPDPARRYVGNVVMVPVE
jgi:hypothetical protein